MMIIFTREEDGGRRGEKIIGYGSEDGEIQK